MNMTKTLKVMPDFFHVVETVNFKKGHYDYSDIVGGIRIDHGKYHPGTAHQQHMSYCDTLKEARIAIEIAMINQFKPPPPLTQGN